MDCAKGINFLYSCGGRMQDYWGDGKATGPLLPMIAVPTTAGTGSETQSYALIADAETHVKMACGDKRAAFRVAILDPELTLTQPPRVTALTGIDAIVARARNLRHEAAQRDVAGVQPRGLAASGAEFVARARRPDESASPRRDAARRLLRRPGDREFDARRGPRAGQSADGDLRHRPRRGGRTDAAARDSPQRPRRRRWYRELVDGSEQLSGLARATIRPKRWPRLSRSLPARPVWLVH